MREHRRSNLQSSAAGHVTCAPKTQLSSTGRERVKRSSRRFRRSGRSDGGPSPAGPVQQSEQNSSHLLQSQRHIYAHTAMRVSLEEKWKVISRMLARTLIRWHRGSGCRRRGRGGGRCRGIIEPQENVPFVLTYRQENDF